MRTTVGASIPANNLLRHLFSHHFSFLFLFKFLPVVRHEDPAWPLHPLNEVSSLLDCGVFHIDRICGVVICSGVAVVLHPAVVEIGLDVEVVDRFPNLSRTYVVPTEYGDVGRQCL